jgi:serine/threonine protein kinase
MGAFLGAGPVGDVFRARQATAARELAAKVVRQPLAASSSVRQRFLAISATVAQFDHPHILPLEYFGEQGSTIFAIMPLVTQGSLMGRLVAGRLSPKDVAPLFSQICDALNYIHGQGMTHGNLKPTNILLYEGKHCLVSDFGQLWQVAEVDLTQNGVGADAVLYMAPEQREGYLDIRSDIYSLGAMLYHALTGVPPFVGQTPFEVLSRHQRQPVPTLQSSNVPLPPSALVFEEILRMALAKDPNARFQTPLAMARAIVEAGKLANDLPSRALPIVTPNGPPMLPPPGGMPPSRPNNQRAGPMPGQMPPGPPYPGMPMPGNPAYGGMQPPPMRPPLPSQPMPMGTLPPQAPSDDPLQWLFADNARPTPSRPMTPTPRPPNPDMADFLTARHAAPEAPPSPPIPETTETGAVPRPTEETGAHPWWESDDEYDDERDFTGRNSRVYPRDWDDDSRSVSVPSMRTPSRPASRDRWEESDDRYRRPDDREQEYSREMTGVRPAARSRPRTESAAYPAMTGERPAPRGKQAQAKAPKLAPERKRRSRLPALLAGVIVLVVIANLGLLVVVAPQHCPGNLCDSLHAKLAPIFGLTATPTAIPTPPLNATLTQKNETFAATVGKSTTVNNAITVTSTNAASLAWQATSDVAWVTLTPVSGTLAADGTAALTVVLNPDATIPAGVYQATITITAGSLTTQIKIAITVASS